jgi:hypothetical protein
MLSRNLSRTSVGGMLGATVAAALTVAAAAEAASPSGSSSGGAIQSATNCVYVLANPGKASGQAFAACESMRRQTGPYGTEPSLRQRQNGG